MDNQILTLLGRPDYTPLTAGELASRLGIVAGKRAELQRALARLERAGQIARIKKGERYALPLEADLVPGRIRMNRQGVGFLQPDDPKLSPLRIPQDATGTAMHGDRVLARRDALPRLPGRAGPPEATGRVVRILEAARTQIVGTLQQGRQFLYVIPDDPRITQDIYVPPPRDVGRPARPGDKVVVELREWKSRHTNPEGEIIEALGPPDAEGVDMLSVIRQYQLALHFPRRVLQEAREFGQDVAAGDLAGRADCREHQVVTIDPDDAKDFDDAICLEPGEGGHWKLWVHIADVSHYVKPGTALDEEASRRGNSTYLVDRVIPMLPEALSNELCSLKPNVDRLTQCAEFLLTAEGRVLKTRFYSAVIRSKCRYTYRDVLAILERQPLVSLERMLHDANRLAQRIRRARMQAGSLDLDFPETKIRLDERGRILRIDKVENDISHQLIEEYMLLANEAVAGRLMSSGKPAMYRIHEPPDPRRLEEFREEVLSHHLQCGDLTQRREVQSLLEKLKSLSIGQALKVRFLRSLMRARYAVEPLGHYGLAKKKYTHFTSPIRRYADLVVHRCLLAASAPGGAALHDRRPQAAGSTTAGAPTALFEGADGPAAAPGSGTLPRAGLDMSSRALHEVADHISETERNSDDAERDSRDVKLFAFLSAQLESPHPPRYSALVTDARNFGFFVDVPGLGMSGLVPLSGLSDDFYQFDANRSHLVGRRTRRVFKLGDKVEVQVAKVDKFKRQVDFKLAGAPRAPGVPGERRGPRERRGPGPRQSRQSRRRG
ncbi:MAG TPA: VacB/RNase II family 3'-5' exoribonuclease [Verrucomicrobiae bacterium]|nr:VacB/RNase II family 3'-5' exoribonuclease [Verrucomicrobiae bacterium]